jgi:hypothetical protein
MTSHSLPRCAAVRELQHPLGALSTDKQPLSGRSAAAVEGTAGNVRACGFGRHQTDIKGVAATPGRTVLGKPAAQRQDFRIGFLTGGEIDIGELVPIVPALSTVIE